MTFIFHVVEALLSGMMSFKFNLNFKLT